MAELATFGGGCFWCIEAVFQKLRGVTKVRSGYAGGHDPKPTYKAVCAGSTGHAEVVEVTYDPQQVRYEDLLEVFFRMHDPTTKDRQGNDVGTQYRSVIMFHSDAQKRAAEEAIRRIDAEKIYPAKVVTEVVPAAQFHEAEGYHQDYYSQNSAQPYCAYVIQPKLEKLKKIFADRLAP